MKTFYLYLMKRFFFNTLVLFGLISITTGSCRKDNSDGSPPVISISAPFDNQTYNVYDTITVVATVSDDKNLSTVTLELTNTSLSDVLPLMNIPVTGKSMSFTHKIVINDVHILSGYYYVQVTASDGYNTIRTYKKIYITAAPRKRTGIYFITRPLSTMYVSKIDSAYNISPVIQWGGDMSESDISSWNQELYVAGYYTGKTYCINLTDKAFKWAQNPIISGNPYFLGIHHFNNFTYVSYYAGYVHGFDFYGNQQKNNNATNGYYPIKMLGINPYFIYEMRDFINTTKKLVVCNANTMFGLQEVVISENVVQLCAPDSDNVLIFGNNNSNQGVLDHYRISTNVNNPALSLPAKVLAATQVDANTYLVAMDNNTIYKYDYFLNQLSTFASGVMAAKIRYDDVNSQAVVAEAKTVKLFSYPSGSLANTVLAADTVRDVQVLFNR